MGYLRDHMIEEMKLRNYSKTTIKMYTKAVHNFAYYFRKSPLSLTQNDIRSYFLNLIEKNASATTLHIIYCSLKLFYRIHSLPHYLDCMPHPRRPFVLPAVLDQSEIQLLLSLCKNLRYKTLFTIIYSAGLRLSEAINLQVTDIDFCRKTIHVHTAKNHKSRYTILSEKAIKLLVKYLSKFHPSTYLFHSLHDRSIRMSGRHVQHVFHNLVLESKLIKKAHVHTLRHSFATQLLENNTNIFYIMQLLGHSSIKSTIIYLHMQRLELLNIQSPLDSSQIDLDLTYPNNNQLWLNIA
jgi:integrase/recombinase XerD